MGLSFDENLNVSPDDVADLEMINDLLQREHPDAPPIPARTSRPCERKQGQPSPADTGERTTTTQPPRQTAAPPPKQKSPCPARTMTTSGKPRRSTWRNAFYVAVGGLCFLALWIVGTAVLSWGSSQIEHYQYGAARISQYDVTLSHGAGASHLLAEYYHGEVVVIEFSPLDPPKGHVSAVLLDPGDQTPRLVSLQVQDVNHDGKPDVIALVEGISITPVFYNNGTSLQATPPHTGGQAA